MSTADLPPCCIWYATDPAEVLRGLVESTEQEMAAMVPGPHNARRLAELTRGLVQYRRWLAAAEGRQPTT